MGGWGFLKNTSFGGALKNKNPHTTMGFLPDPRSASCQGQTRQHGPDGAFKKLIGHLILHIEKNDLS